MTRSHTLIALSLVLGGCVTEASLLSQASTPACDDDTPTVAGPDEVGCTTIEVDGDDTLACDYSHVPDGGTFSSPLRHGAWVRLQRAFDRPTELRVEAISGCDGASDCSVFFHYGDGCACGEGFESRRAGAGAEAIRLPPGDSALLLPGAGRRYRVSVCTLEPAPWPVYPGCGNGSAWESTDDGGTCMPWCASDADCPVPTSGTASPTCSAYGTFCELTCGAGETCPDGQHCASFRGRMRCAAPLAP